ncbi:hypothetical protein F4604DRAFT_1932935 [Suillus subluteus]|nr:hypothetical protein F4604DRAFT_1932935 [Suillus subluteus]
MSSDRKEHGYDDVKLFSIAWDMNLVSASNTSGDVAFAILPLSSPFATVPNFLYKLPDIIPRARIHTAPVRDIDWSPHNDSIIALGVEDGKVTIWKVESTAFGDWG